MNNQITNTDIVISADAHVGETDELRRRLPKRFRDMLPELRVDTNGNLEFWVKGKMVDGQAGCKPTEEDLLREFRSDPSQGTNIDRRLHDMALEGVDAQVIFPNIGLSCSLGTHPADFYHAWASAYNDYVRDIFSVDPKRFKPAAMLAVDNVEDTVSEAALRIKQGFCTLFLPNVVPWQPYSLAVYEPLWALAAESGVPLNFHVFGGNLALTSSFAYVPDLSQKRIDQAKQVDKDAEVTDELLTNTIIGMAAGLSTIVELTSAGVLERYPGLRFVVTESECGWLAWTLQAMDQIQQRRHLKMRKLALKPSGYFLRQGAITISDDPVGLNNICFTGTDCLIWGNDYPHDEGTFPTVASLWSI